MSLETEVAALKVAVETLTSVAAALDTSTQSAYNTAVATATTKAGEAAAQAVIATTQAGVAASQAVAASASATNSQDSANNASAAVLSQLNTIKTQTETARDAALAGLGAADNSQLLSTLSGQETYAADIAGQLVRELEGLPTGIDALANFVGEMMDLLGATARQASATPQLVPAPANASARGSTGEWAWDSGFIYVCTALNTWKRVAIATW